MIKYFSQELLNPSDKDEGGTIVYTHNLAQSKILHDFGSTEYGATWLKLTHPDPIYDEKIDDNSGGIRVRTSKHLKTIGKIYSIWANLFLLCYL